MVEGAGREAPPVLHVPWLPPDAATILCGREAVPRRTHVWSSAIRCGNWLAAASNKTRGPAIRAVWEVRLDIGTLGVRPQTLADTAWDKGNDLVWASHRKSATRQRIEKTARRRRTRTSWPISNVSEIIPYSPPQSRDRRGSPTDSRLVGLALGSPPAACQSARVRHAPSDRRASGHGLNNIIPSKGRFGQPRPGVSVGTPPAANRKCPLPNELRRRPVAGPTRARCEARRHDEAAPRGGPRVDSARQVVPRADRAGEYSPPDPS